MKTLLGFGALNASNSINVELARFATHFFSDMTVNFIDLNEYEMPIFSIDREQDSGVPDAAHRFKAQIFRRCVLRPLCPSDESPYGDCVIAVTVMVTSFSWTSRMASSLRFWL